MILSGAIVSDEKTAFNLDAAVLLRYEDGETLYRRCSRASGPVWLRGAANGLDETGLNAGGVQ